MTGSANAVASGQKSAMVSFSFFPPEFNTELIYTARGTGQLSPAASAWGALGAGLSSAADSFRPAISALITNWPGSSVIEIAGVVAQYASWLNATVAQIAQVTAKAKAAAAALETAFAMTVPPLVIEANRAWFRKLAKANLLGQDSLAVAATEAHYLEMWAQDAAAMNGYMAAWRDVVRTSAYGVATATTDSAGETLSTENDPDVGNQLASFTNSNSEMRWALGSLIALAAPPGNCGQSVSPESAQASEAVSAADTAERLAMYPISTLAQAPQICETGAAVVPTGDALVNRSGHLKSRNVQLIADRAARHQHARRSVVSAHMGGAMSFDGLSVPSVWRATVAGLHLANTALETTKSGPKHRRQVEHAVASTER